MHRRHRIRSPQPDFDSWGDLTELAASSIACGIESRVPTDLWLRAWQFVLRAPVNPVRNCRLAESGPSFRARVCSVIRLLLLATLGIWLQNLLCGRFNIRDPKAIVERFGFMDWSDKRIEPRFNIAPSQEILTIVQLPLERPQLVLQTAVWGLKPFWLAKGKPPPINARAEALGSSQMFREAQHCLILASGFYEWRNRQPMHIQLRDGQPFAFAGLWLPPVHHASLPTAAIITTKPNELMATIHTRMPAILRPEDELRWLDPALDNPRQLLAPLSSDLMEAYPVSNLVNSWENEGPELVTPIEPAVREEQIGLPFT
jgi:putative SOS response-associated peptidase YedK